MMMSSNGNISRVTGPLWGEPSGHRWIPLTKASVAGLWCFLWSAPDKQLSKQSRTNDLRRHRVHYDTIVMLSGNFNNLFLSYYSLLMAEVSCESALIWLQLDEKSTLVHVVAACCLKVTSRDLCRHKASKCPFIVSSCQFKWLIIELDSTRYQIFSITLSWLGLNSIHSRVLCGDRTISLLSIHPLYKSIISTPDGCCYRENHSKMQLKDKYREIWFKLHRISVNQSWSRDLSRCLTVGG